MSEFLEIALSLVNKNLTFFLGTGFSKHLTNGKAPNWKELLVDCTNEVDSSGKLLQNLFSPDEDGTITNSRFPLPICAQILELEYTRDSKDIRLAIQDILSKRINDDTINNKKVRHFKKFIKSHPYINFITTNYDTLISDYINPAVRVFVEGSAVPRANTGQNIFHIHGSIKNPNSLILTLNDYYRFQLRENYFSRKFYTVLQESAVVIMGYSLEDYNLNSILNEVNLSRFNSIRRNNIYYVTRDVVDEIYKQFYSYTYGIHVIDNCEIDEFIDALSEHYGQAEKILKKVVDLENVLYKDYEYIDDYLKFRSSLSEILYQADTIGVERTNPKFIRLLRKLLVKKYEFTREDGAWGQYVHLADWLIEIGKIIEIKGSRLESKYIELVGYSLRMMSKKIIRGYSWAAFDVWNYRWKELLIENQKFIKEFIVEEFNETDSRGMHDLYK